MSFGPSPEPAWAEVADDDALTRGVPVRRVFAWLIDAVLIILVLLALWPVLLVLGVLPLVPLLYHVLFLAGPATATPGQQMLGLIVCRDADLGRPTFLQALVSTLLFYATLAAGVIWLAAALVTVRRRTLHDIAAGLVVVRLRALTDPASFWNMEGGMMGR